MRNLKPSLVILGFEESANQSWNPKCKAIIPYSVFHHCKWLCETLQKSGLAYRYRPISNNCIKNDSHKCSPSTAIKSVNVKVGS